MRQPGQIVLVPFPYTDLSGAKLRPALMIRQASRHFDDWLVAMISSRLHRADADLDEIVRPTDADWLATGLKAPSVVRLSRLAVVDGGLLAGCLGAIDFDRLTRLRLRLVAWILKTQ